MEESSNPCHHKEAPIEIRAVHIMHMRKNISKKEQGSRSLLKSIIKMVVKKSALI